MVVDVIWYLSRFQVEMVGLSRNNIVSGLRKRLNLFSDVVKSFCRNNHNLFKLVTVSISDTFLLKEKFINLECEVTFM